MEKCLQIGMEMKKVQITRDRHDNTKAHWKHKVDPEHPLPNYSLVNYNNMRLKGIHEHFNDMLGARKRAFPRRKILKHPHLGEALKIFQKDVFLAYDWIRHAFPEMKGLPAVEQWILYRNFYLKFNIFEPAYLAILLGKTKTFHLPNGDVADEVSKYYTRHLESPPDVSLDHVSKVFTPYWTAFHNCIVIPVLAANLSIYEFLLLAAIFLWDSGLDGLSRESAEIAHRTRAHLLFELTTVTRQAAENEDHEMRLARNMLLLNGVQKGSDLFEEELQLGSLYRILSPEATDWYHLTKGPTFF